MMTMVGDQYGLMLKEPLVWRQHTDLLNGHIVNRVQMVLGSGIAAVLIYDELVTRIQSATDGS